MQRKTTATRASFGAMPDGTPVEVFTLTNVNGLELRAISYGAIIVSLKVPDRNGKSDDVVFGHDALGGYLKGSQLLGAVAGGERGLDKVVWEVAKDAVKAGSREAAVTLTRLSPDAEGHPGNLNVSVTYVLTDENELLVAYAATTDKATPIHLTQHSYFNLAGHHTKDILDHRLMVNASRYAAIDATLSPTGSRPPVADTPFDFRTPTRIGARIGEAHEQLKVAAGYNHTFALNRQGTGLVLAARLDDPSTGRIMDVLTTQPGLQVETANRLDGSITGKSGAAYGRHGGVSLATQPAFPAAILNPGESFEARTVYKFR